MKKRNLTGLAVFLAAACISGCGAAKEETGTVVQSSQAKSAAEEAVEITFFSNSTYLVKANDEINESLQKQYPYLTVHIEHVADNFEAVLKTKLQTGSAPDLFSWMSGVAGQPFMEAGQVEDLSDAGLRELLLPNFAEAGSFDGRLYAVPTSLQSEGLLYNKDCFEKAGIENVPRTVSELEEAVDRLNAVGIQPFASGLKEQWVCYQWFWFAQSPFQDDMMQWYHDMNDGKASFDNEGTREFFKVFDLMYENCGPNPLSSDFASMCHQLGAGEAAMALMGDFAYSESMKVNPEARLGLAGMPVDENPENAVIINNASGIYVSSESKHKDAAFDFLRWSLSKEGTELISRLDGAGSTAACNPELELIGFSADGMKWIQDGKRALTATWNYWAPGIMDVIGKDLQAYFTGSMSIDELFQDLDAQWNNAIQ